MATRRGREGQPGLPIPQSLSTLPNALLHTAAGALERDHQSKSGETDAVFTRWSYPIVAFLLGVIWYVGFLLPEVTRGWLLHFPIAHLLIMCVSSLLVALSARKLISRARGIMHVVLAVMLPV